jgi:hypothetical protein
MWHPYGLMIVRYEVRKQLQVHIVILLPSYAFLMMLVQSSVGNSCNMAAIWLQYDPLQSSVGNSCNMAAIWLQYGCNMMAIVFVKLCDSLTD